MSDSYFNLIGNERISDRQINELIGIARGLGADGVINQAEVEFLQSWLAANSVISGQPVIRTLYQRIEEMLSDGVVDGEERAELLDTLNSFSNRDCELGEVLKSTTLPLCNPAPALVFDGRRYCFTGTFNFGSRSECEAAAERLGARCGSLTQKTDVLVIGIYATESWKHSSFGNKIMKACEFRDKGVPIAIVSEEHWVAHLPLPEGIGH